MESEIDPWPVAQEALFEIMRVWTTGFPEVDQQKIAGECFRIMSGVNETPGAPFVFVCELARMIVNVLAKYLCVCLDKFPDVGEMLAEIQDLELEYIEEFVVAEAEDDNIG
jgi:hypothetical protein